MSIQASVRVKRLVTDVALIGLSVRVQVCRIKAALGEGCISNRYRAGYYLTKKGLAQVAQLMEQTDD